MCVLVVRVTMVLCIRAVPRLPLATKAKVLVQVRIVLVVATMTTGAIALLVTFATATDFTPQPSAGCPSAYTADSKSGPPQAAYRARARPLPKTPTQKKRTKKKKDEEQTARTARTARAHTPVCCYVHPFCATPPQPIAAKQRSPVSAVDPAGPADVNIPRGGRPTPEGFPTWVHPHPRRPPRRRRPARP